MITNIKVTDANRDKIESAIKQAEGRAKARTVIFREIMASVREIENHYGIAKKLMTGIKVSVDANAQDFPNAYKYTPESTHFVVERKSSGWYLTSIERDECRRASRRFVLVDPLTEEQKEALLKQYDAWM